MGGINASACVRASLVDGSALLVQQDAQQRYGVCHASPGFRPDDIPRNGYPQVTAFSAGQ